MPTAYHKLHQRCRAIIRNIEGPQLNRQQRSHHCRCVVGFGVLISPICLSSPFSFGPSSLRPLDVANTHGESWEQKPLHMVLLSNSPNPDPQTPPFWPSNRTAGLSHPAVLTAHIEICNIDLATTWTLYRFYPFLVHPAPGIRHVLDIMCFRPERGINYCPCLRLVRIDVLCPPTAAPKSFDIPHEARKKSSTTSERRCRYLDC